MSSVAIIGSKKQNDGGAALFAVRVDGIVRHFGSYTLGVASTIARS
jgi:hypothetical protein